MLTTLARSIREEKELISLAAPIAGVQLAQVALTTTDLAMMGLMDVTAVAAGGLALILYNQLRTMCVGMVTAVGNLVAGAAGRGETRAGKGQLDQQARDDVGDTVRGAFLVSTVSALVACVLLVSIGQLLALPLFGQSAEIVAAAQPVILTLSSGYLPMVWLNVLRQFAVGMRRPGSLLAVTVASIAINAALDGAFIYGWGGMPKLGLAGIGLATTLVNLLTFLAFLAMVLRDEKLAPLLSFRGWGEGALRQTRTITRLGVPICLTYGSEAGLTSLATLVMGSFGPISLAAFNVVNQLAYVVYQVSIGLSQGASILVSRHVSQGKSDLAARVARSVLAIAGTLLVLVGAAYIAVPDLLLRPFLDAKDAAALPLAETFLLFAIAQQITKAAQNINVGLLRGLGDTKGGLKATMIGYWAVGAPVMLLCAYGLHWRGFGVWTGLCVGFGATAAILVRRFSARVHLTRAEAV